MEIVDIIVKDVSYTQNQKIKHILEALNLLTISDIFHGTMKQQVKQFMKIVH